MNSVSSASRPAARAPSRERARSELALRDARSRLRSRQQPQHLAAVAARPARETSVPCARIHRAGAEQAALTARRVLACRCEFRKA